MYVGPFFWWRQTHLIVFLYLAWFKRIVAEVWEAFKHEHLEALTQAFQGMTDKEIEEIEQDILQHNCMDDTLSRLRAAFA